MLYISKKLSVDQVEIMDTDDGIAEPCNIKDLPSIVQKGITIYGVAKNLCVIPKSIAPLFELPIGTPVTIDVRGTKECIYCGFEYTDDRRFCSFNFYDESGLFQFSLQFLADNNFKFSHHIDNTFKIASLIKELKSQGNLQ